MMRGGGKADCLNICSIEVNFSTEISSLMDKTNQKRRTARRITADYLHHAALYYLERYAASEGRVRRILTQKIKRSCKDHPDQVEADLIPLIDAEIDRLRTLSYINDDQLAEQLIQGYSTRGTSRRMIALRLQQRGFAPGTIQALLNQMPPDIQQENEQGAARRYLQRRKLWPYHDPSKVDDKDQAARHKARARAFAALGRQGYSPDIITAAMDTPTE